MKSGTTLRTALIEFPSVEQGAAAHHHRAAYQKALRVPGDPADREILSTEAVE